MGQTGTKGYVYTSFARGAAPVFVNMLCTERSRVTLDLEREGVLVVWSSECVGQDDGEWVS